jgi:hypothetical protein
MVDFDKVPLAKAFPFLASVLPGFSLLYLFEAANPGTIRWYFSVNFLGYRTEVSLLLFVSFLLGYSLNKFLAAFYGAIGGVWGATRGIPMFDRHPYELTVAPWRDKKWRAAYSRRFAGDLPQDLTMTLEPFWDKIAQEASSTQPDSAILAELSSQAEKALKVALVSRL